MSRTDRLSRSIAILLGVAFAASLLAAVPARAADLTPALAPTPNTSIAFYRPPKGGKPGLLERGTLSNGTYTRKGAFKTGKWTAIAVGRDSMALYDRGSGRLLTGRFRNGVWKPVRRRSIARGFSHVVASCDSIHFYRRSDGKGMTAEFTSGDIRDVRRLRGPHIGADYQYGLVDASCDMVYFHGRYQGTGTIHHVGFLRDGHYEHFGTNGLLSAPRHLATNTDSFIILFASQTPWVGNWGRLRNGEWSTTGQANDFGEWDIVAGAADTLVFYRRADGLAATATLRGGDYLFVGVLDPGLKRGWRIIAGGR